KLIALFAKKSHHAFNVSVFSALNTLPHFDPVLSIENVPPIILQLRKEIEQADGILICTPIYIFTIPSGLKNLLEWCVATTIFTNKPCGIITASAQGERGQEQLHLVMKTLMAKFNPDTTLLIPGIKGKIDPSGELIHPGAR